MNTPDHIHRQAIGIIRRLNSDTLTPTQRNTLELELSDLEATHGPELLATPKPGGPEVEADGSRRDNIPEDIVELFHSLQEQMRIIDESSAEFSALRNEAGSLHVKYGDAILRKDAPNRRPPLADIPKARPIEDTMTDLQMLNRAAERIEAEKHQPERPPGFGSNRTPGRLGHTDGSQVTVVGSMDIEWPNWS